MRAGGVAVGGDNNVSDEVDISGSVEQGESMSIEAASTLAGLSRSTDMVSCHPFRSNLKDFVSLDNIR